ncbi:glycerol-3-phosphate responsive antiterminator [Paenibacillus harenae]|uniref:Glycerol uptake operon antiterminator regulatory protein n=1 Tax=Paenibacillus harenae TaxID=306543 RepID=A0ABT9TYE9_PAEHA|nr:glycerol-3-phosphate responsive antiterminator [Paenibacillus harenae]MDQ0060054.1 glycerol uptake operon antiterminator [Paenibacillus harenae]MDQ0112396.1 glycerol uptake operon antiterminator [Paenibacillus harenae]
MPLLSLDQIVLPAVRKQKDVEAVIATPYTYMVLLGGHLGQLKPIVDLANQHGKKVLLHADLIDGLKNDEYAAEFLCQSIRPSGLISTRSTVIARTKKNGLIAIQRLFLIDSDAIEHSYTLLEKTRPDYIEVLPGIMPDMIREVKERSGIPIIAGGLIRTPGDVSNALAAGASAITTSRKELWQNYR